MIQDKMDSELKQLEEELRGFSPSPMSGEVLSRMLVAMDRWEEAEVEPEDLEAAANGDNVVAFPIEKTGRSSWGPMWAAAAAVAILGAAMGILVPGGESEEQIAAMQGVGPVPVFRQASLVPVNVSRKVSSMETGKVSNRDGVECQVIRVVREEQADFRGTGNVGLKITRPKWSITSLPFLIKEPFSVKNFRQKTKF